MTRLLRKLALAAASGALVLLLGEAVLALAGMRPTQVRSVSAAEYAALPGMFAPRQDVWNVEKPALPHRIRINALGFRGSETTRVPARRRVVCIGDSFTFGDFVEDGETLPARLEALFDGSVEFVNGGVGGSTILDQRVFLERLLDLSPDAVLLLYSENDLLDLRAASPLHARLARNRELRSGPLGPVYRLVRDTAWFHLYRRAGQNLRHRRREQIAQASAGAAGPASPLPDEMGERYVSETAALRDRLARRGTPLVFAAYPWPSRLEIDPDGNTIPALLERLRGVGIVGVDLTPALRASGLDEQELYLIPHDEHPSPAGYAIAARAIAPQIEAALNLAAAR